MKLLCLFSNFNNKLAEVESFHYIQVHSKKHFHVHNLIDLMVFCMGNKIKHKAAFFQGPTKQNEAQPLEPLWMRNKSQIVFRRFQNIYIDNKAYNISGYEAKCCPALPYFSFFLFTPIVKNSRSPPIFSGATILNNRGKGTYKLGVALRPSR